MFTASEARKTSLKGDPQRMLIIAETGIKEAATNKETRCTIKFSKHLYGDQDVRMLILTLHQNGYHCLEKSLFGVESNNHEIEIRW